jgi:hypothetical protein
MNDNYKDLFKTLDVNNKLNSIDFKKQFNGIYIKSSAEPLSNEGAIGYFNLYANSTNTQAGIAVYYNDSLKVVGLIDPSTYATEIPFGKNTILYCDPRNWGTSGFYGQTRKRLEWYCNNSINYGDKVICFSQGGTHMNFKILKSFYDKFGDRL